MRNADVVVVGGGIIGVSIAHQLATRSDLRVVVCEKGSAPGEGSTGASSSIIRARYSDDRVVRLAVEATAVWRRWEAFLDGPVSAQFVQTGGVWIGEGLAAAVDHDVTRLTIAGARVERVGSLGEFDQRLSSCVQPLDLRTDVDHECRPGEAFLHEPDAGYVDPMAALEDLIGAARRAGVEYMMRCQVVEVVRRGDQIAGVRLGDGSTIETPVVVNAAGPWAAGLDALAGAAHGWPLIPTRVQTAYLAVPMSNGDGIPIIFDGPCGLYMRPDGSRLLVGGTTPADESERIVDPDSLQRTTDSPFRDRMVAGLGHRCPTLVTGGTTSGVAGLYTINTTDVHPIVGQTGPDGYWVAAGFSGHGFKLAPMIGCMLARAITGQTGPDDPTAGQDLFSPNRQPFRPTEHSVIA